MKVLLAEFAVRDANTNVRTPLPKWLMMRGSVMAEAPARELLSIVNDHGLLFGAGPKWTCRLSMRGPPSQMTLNVAGL